MVKIRSLIPDKFEIHIHSFKVNLQIRKPTRVIEEITVPPVGVGLANLDIK